MILGLSRLFLFAYLRAFVLFSAYGLLRKLRLTDTIESMIGAFFPKAPARHQSSLVPFRGGKGL